MNEGKFIQVVHSLSSSMEVTKYFTKLIPLTEADIHHLGKQTLAKTCDFLGELFTNHFKICTDFF